jgi:TatD DNase family protein
MNIELFDSHTHIDMVQFDNDRDQMLGRAREAGLCGMVVPGVDLWSSEAIISSISGVENVFCAIGTHPNSAGKGVFFDRKRANLLADDEKVVAVGEIGLDYYRDHAAHDVQQECMRVWLEWAKGHGLPVIVHVRDAFEDAFKIIGEIYSSDNAGVMHCFSGSIEDAQRSLDLGYMISFAGQITYKNAQDLRDVVEYVPIERMMVETDAPYLSPVPHRGKRNEPAYVRHTVEKIADIKNMPVADVAGMTTKNARELFNINV